ncbi:OTU deubiquitinase with linear linkage specificity a [Pagrus major]|uniref:OTU deubiquitinase with linear linkage specificity a n=1 Tax=Pagrus major TaxID=143350 RepID=UPI003CC85B29
MSWVKAVSLSADDVFDQSADDFNLSSKEWASNMKKRIRDGFVDGADAGEDASLQAGFNLGYSEGAALTVAVGRLKGIASAILCWCQMEHPESPVPASVTDLLHRVSQHEDRVMNRIKEALENPPPSVSSVSDGMEDLEVKPADSGCCSGGGCDKTECCSGGGCNKTDCCSGGGCNKTDCCKGAEKMDLDAPQQRQKPHPGSTDCSSSSSEGMNDLLQRCRDVVSELGLPQELIGHIEELRNM